MVKWLWRALTGFSIIPPFPVPLLIGTPHQPRYIYQHTVSNRPTQAYALVHHHATRPYYMH